MIEHEAPIPVSSHGIKTILIVEDDTLIGEFLVQVIAEETSYHALLVTTGFEALFAIQDLKPSLFLLDYTLPRMNGLELYDQLQLNPHMQDVPVIFLSANLPIAELEQRRVKGIAKPVDVDVLLNAITHILEQ